MSWLISVKGDEQLSSNSVSTCALTKNNNVLVPTIVTSETNIQHVQGQSMIVAEGREVQNEVEKCEHNKEQSSLDLSNQKLIPNDENPLISVPTHEVSVEPILSWTEVTVTSTSQPDTGKNQVIAESEQNKANCPVSWDVDFSDLIQPSKPKKRPKSGL